MTKAQGGKPNRAAAAGEDLLFPNQPALFQGRIWDRKDFARATQDAWFNTPDEGLLPNNDSHDTEISTIANFRWRKLIVQRETFNVDLNDPTSYRNSPIIQRIKAVISETYSTEPENHPIPKDHLILFTMARVLVEERKKNRKSPANWRTSREGNFMPPDWKRYWIQALDEIWGYAEKWGRLQDAYDAANPELIAVMREIEDNYKLGNHNPVHNRFLRADHEAIVTVEKPTTVKTIPDDVIYIAMDRCQVVITFRWPEGLQYLYEEKVPETVARQLTTYFSIKPPPFPDQPRHPLHDRWLASRPEFDKWVTNGGCSGVEHFGFGAPSGNPTGPIQRRPASHPKRQPEVQRIRDEMVSPAGLFGTVGEAVQFVHECLDPKLLDAQRQTIAQFPEHAVITTGEEAYSIWAVLVNTKTESHVDESDWEKGLALMTPVGDFRGADLVSLELGIRLEFKPGSIAAIRGHELSHFTTSWTGSTRLCIVHAIHEAVRRQGAERMRATRAEEAELPTSNHTRGRRRTEGLEVKEATEEMEGGRKRRKSKR
ncbi:hypothetical protein MMC12_006805 [Toensbergia leucococca]|nr:hypothetical protein [Toensbergia leucococca]